MWNVSEAVDTQDSNISHSTTCIRNASGDEGNKKQYKSERHYPSEVLQFIFFAG